MVTINYYDTIDDYDPKFGNVVCDECLEIINEYFYVLIMKAGLASHIIICDDCYFIFSDQVSGKRNADNDT